MKKPICFAWVLSMMAAGGLSAQTYEQVAPKELPAAPTPPLPETPPPGPGAADDTRVLAPALRGLVFVGDPAALEPQGVSEEGLHLAGVPRLDRGEFRARIAPHLGQPVTFARLQAITRETVLFLREADRPVVDVVVPEQNIHGGTVQILVVEGRLGQVGVEGNRWFASDRLARAVRTGPGEVLAGSELLADLAWLNQNPFRRADLIFARGTGPGETDVILHVQDRRPFRVYAGYEDTGTPLTDEDRLLAGFNWGDAFGLDHQLNYQYTASPDFDEFTAHSGSYVIPLPWRHTLTFFGSYATSRPDLGGGLFTLDGKSWQASARYRMPLPGGRGIEHAVTAGFDFKRSNNNLAFGGTQVFAQDTDIVQAVLAYSASRADKWGMTSAELSVFLSPGGIGGHNSQSDLRASRSFAEADYVYARLDVERRTRLPAGFAWVARGQGQLASTNLLGSEQLGFGGAGSLRGYDEREANGDSGAILVNELHAPPIPVARRLGLARADDGLTLLAFLDVGVAVVKRPLPGEERTRELMSAGLGLRYSLGANVAARFDYGWQLRDSGVSPTGDNRRAHVSVVVAY